MDVFDQFLIRGVKIIFWKGPALAMEERQLLGEVMLKYPLLFSLLPESSRKDTMEFLKKKMLELGVQKVDELNCFRVMNGHLFWEMLQPKPLTEFELVLEEFLFRQRLESAVRSLANERENYQEITGKFLKLEGTSTESEHFIINQKSTRYQCTNISKCDHDHLNRTNRCNQSSIDNVKEDNNGLPEEHFFCHGGSSEGFQDFKVEKRIDHTDDFQNEYRAITFHPIRGTLDFNELGENIRHDVNNGAVSCDN